MISMFINKKTLITTLLGLAFVCGGCSLASKVSVSVPPGHQVTVKQKAWVKDSDSEPRQLNAGDTLTLKDKPILVEAPGHVGVILIPVNHSESNIDVNLRPMKSWASDASQEIALQITSKILIDINGVFEQLKSGQTQSAFSRVQQLRKAYPSLVYLKYLEASCLMVLGQTEAAKKLMAEAEQELPTESEVDREPSARRPGQ